MPEWHALHCLACFLLSLNRVFVVSRALGLLHHVAPQALTPSPHCTATHCTALYCPTQVYRTKVDDESGVLNVSAAANCLNLVLRDEGLMKFVKVR